MPGRIARELRWVERRAYMFCRSLYDVGWTIAAWYRKLDPTEQREAREALLAWLIRDELPDSQAADAAIQLLELVELVPRIQGVIDELERPGASARDAERAASLRISLQQLQHNAK